eukprot:3355039-Amphidinium_carterae.1
MKGGKAMPEPTCSQPKHLRHELEYSKKLYDNQVKMVKFVGAIHANLAQHFWDYEWPELEEC